MAAKKQVDEATASPSSDIVISTQPGELSPIQSQAQAIAFQQTPENIELLKKSLADAKTILSDSELGIFLYQAQKTGLDPLARQIYVMKKGDSGGVSFMTSIDGQRLVAQRTKEYDGQTPPQWCGKDGAWREVWLEDTDPAAARVGVYRKGMREPVYAVATWKSYARYTNVWVNGKKTNDIKPMGVWGQMGDVMLAKCAEALALRKAFPQELSGLYTPEEMNADSEDAPSAPVVMTAKDALAKAGKSLVEKGFSREEALIIMTGIAGVDDVSRLTGNTLRPVLDAVEKEDVDALAQYLPSENSESDIPEGEVVPPTHSEDFHQPDSKPASKTDEVAPVTDDDLAALAGEEPVSSPAPSDKYTLPAYKKGGSNLVRPEMIKQYKAWLKEADISKADDIAALSQRVLKKKSPGSFDDYLKVLQALANILNNHKEQGSLV